MPEKRKDDDDDEATAGGAGGSGAGSDDDDDEEDEGRPARTFSQSDLDRISSREAKKAARKARQDLADQWGVSLDEVEGILKDRKEKADAEVSDAEKATKAAADRESKAEEREARARAREARADLKAALLDGDDDEPGVNRARVDTVLKLYLDDVLDSDDDDLTDAIADVVAKARKEVPEFFGSGESSNGETRGTPPGPNRKLSERGAGPNPGAKSKAQEVFERRQASRRGPTMDDRKA